MSMSFSRRLQIAFVLGCMLLLAAGVGGSVAHAAPRLTFTVNSTADADDGNCNVANCTLREAILAANTAGAPASILFNITGGGVRTIRPTTPLPAITTNELEINGYSQPGASPNTLTVGDNAVLRIELDGHRAPASTNGLTLNSNSNVVRGVAINRFSDSAFLVFGDFNVIEGNFIGTDATGMVARANGEGMNLCSGSIKNHIGSATPAGRNLISGNTYTGINMSRCSNPTAGNTVEGNYIGTNRNGDAALPNSIGISLSGGSHVVGGLNASARNVIAGNGYGIVFYNAVDSIASANFIGTTANGKHALGNGTGVYLYGYLVDGFSSGNRIGGDTKPEANRIAFNTGTGIVVGRLLTDGDAKNKIQHNFIYSNGGLGIDLGNNGVTANDSGDGDTGPNLLQNFPQLKRAISTTRLIKGGLHSTPNTLFTLEFFSNPACDATGKGEGKKFLGRTTGMTDGLGVLHFELTASKRFAVGNAITATATDPDGNTSEFSKCRTAS